MDGTSTVDSLRPVTKGHNLVVKVRSSTTITTTLSSRTLQGTASARFASQTDGRWEIAARRQVSLLEHSATPAPIVPRAIGRCLKPRPW